MQMKKKNGETKHLRFTLVIKSSLPPSKPSQRLMGRVLNGYNTATYKRARRQGSTSNEGFKHGRTTNNSYPICPAPGIHQHTTDPQSSNHTLASLRLRNGSKGYNQSAYRRRKGGCDVEMGG